MTQQWEGNMELNAMHRLYASLIGYRRNFEEIEFKASSAAQDLDSLMQELKQVIDGAEVKSNESNACCGNWNDDNYVIQGDTESDGQYTHVDLD